MMKNISEIGVDRLEIDSSKPEESSCTETIKKVIGNYNQDNLRNHLVFQRILIN